MTEILDDVETLFEEGMTIDEIASTLKINTEIVYDFMVEWYRNL
jgi:orotate phosphoribosyltransferase-like protein